MGFGAYHWRASGPDTILFVTLDQLGGATHDRDPRRGVRRSRRAVHLGSRLRPGPARDDDGRLHRCRSRETPSARRRGGSAPPPATAPCPARGRSRHGTPSTACTRPALPARSPTGGHSSNPHLADDLAQRTAGAWDSGPYGEDARTAIADHLDDIARWTATYHQLAATTDPDTWVATHGEPHTRNQLLTAEAMFLIDWESLKLAPRERDLRVLDDAGHPQRDADEAMVEMFDLEWRLDEISQYAAWFEAWHTGTESDAIAFGGLTGELTREGRHIRR